MSDLGPTTQTRCLDDYTLAAFVDGRGTPEERRQVQEHLSDCEDCYFLLAEVLRSEDELTRHRPSGSESPRPAKAKLARSWRWMVMASTGAAAASLLLLMQTRDPSPVTELVSIVGEQRFTLVRPTGGFRYGPLRSPERSGRDPDRLALYAAESTLRRRAEQGTPADVQALGVAQLLAGRPSESVETLEQAVRSHPEAAAFHADLGAARLTAFMESRVESLGAEALGSIDRALALDPGLLEARYNRALALEALNRPREAIEAWDHYLTVDSDSPWADEARRRRQALAAEPQR